MVRVYRSTDASAPVLSGTAGALITLLNAVLVNGYSTVSVSSITRSGTTATATTSTSHGFATGTRVIIAGADQSEYNGEFAVTATGATTFTYTVSGSPASPATGTITAKRAGSGWTQAFSGTNKAAYRNDNAAGTGMYWRFDDGGPGAGGAKEARFVGYESMTDVDTGTGDFPTATQFSFGRCCRKSATADATARAWQLFADERTAYLIIETGDTNGYSWIGFGDIYSYKPSDLYRAFAIGRNTENSTSMTVAATGVETLGALTNSPVTGTKLYIPRAYTGTGTAIEAGCHSDYVAANAATAVGGGGQTYPHPADNGLHLARVFIHESNLVRGFLRGIWNPLHTKPLAHGDTFSGVGGLSGKTFVALNAGASGQVCIETSSTWE